MFRANKIDPVSKLSILLVILSAVIVINIEIVWIKLLAILERTHRLSPIKNLVLQKKRMMLVLWLSNCGYDVIFARNYWNGFLRSS